LKAVDFFWLIVLSVVPGFWLGTYLLKNTGGHGLAGFYGGLFVGVSVAVLIVYGYCFYKDSRK
jgi:hypothetical protein